MAREAPRVKDDPKRPAAAIENDALFAVKAALKRGRAIRREANAHFDDLLLVIERLERRGEPPPR